MTQTTVNTSVDFDVLLPSTLSEPPRTLRSVRRRHINQRPPLPSFAQLRRSSPPLPPLPNNQSLYRESFPSNDAETTRITVSVQPPTESTSPHHSIATDLSSIAVDKLARRERKRKWKEQMNMPLPPLPQEEPYVEENEMAIETGARNSTETAVSEEPIRKKEVERQKYLPQEVYSHLLELAERAICRNSLGSTDSMLSKSEDDAPLSAVHGVVQSHRYREMISEMLSATEKCNSAKVYEATAKDEQKVAGMMAAVLSSEKEKEIAKGLKDADADAFMDALQQILEENNENVITRDHVLRTEAKKLLVELSKLSSGLPLPIFISGVRTVQDGRCSFGGTFGDVYKSSYEGEQVALKRLRTFQNNSHDARHRIFQKFCKEALIWRQLDHKFILPFLGIDAENFPRHPCMVSPWMANGTIMQFLKKNPKADINRLLFGIIQGINYLHSKKVVHGDLKGFNILIDEKGQPRIADFGLTVFADATRQNTTDHGGTVRWMAPELLFSPVDSHHRRTPASDIYAYGCVCVEVYTGKPPFPDIGEAKVILEVSTGKRPKRPNVISDRLWSLVQSCWHENRDDRPKSQQVMAEFERIVESAGIGPTASAVLISNNSPVITFSVEGTAPLRPDRSDSVETHGTPKTFTPYRRLTSSEHSSFLMDLQRVRKHADPQRIYQDLKLVHQSPNLEVFSARIKGTNSSVAIKKALVGQHRASLRRLVDEFNEMRFLHHPNILNYIDLFQHDGHLWVILETVAQPRTLKDEISDVARRSRSVGLQESHLANIMRHVVQAVHYLHRHNITHGSIDSEQVVFGQGSRIARLKLCAMLKETTSTSPGRLAAPEIKGDNAIGPAVDIWSLGVLAVEMFDRHIDLTRERADLILQILNRAQPPSSPLRSFLNRTLQETPALRPSAFDLLQDGFLGGSGGTRPDKHEGANLHRTRTEPQSRIGNNTTVNRTRTYIYRSFKE
ncbi:hypothetical protein VNI00_003646 [Paramarasmius palmivorus]|uniref:Protein kinase domain-containing protein n=1 Tax=Paramarasmius palmivorus TaxID=297713 RepID=A0AAW0DS89_9AGAR